MIRWIVVLVGLAGLLGAGLYFQATRPVFVAVAKAQRRAIGAFIEERGKTRLPDIYRITMPSPGRIMPIELDEGSPVRSGQVVAEMNREDLATAVVEAQARVQRLEARIDENDDDRLERSALEGTVEFLDSMDRTVEAATEQTVASKARYDFNEKELARARKLFERDSTSQVNLNRAELDDIESRVEFQTDVLTQRAMEALQKGMRILPRSIQESIEMKALARAVLEKEKAEAESQLEQRLRDQRRGALTSPVDGIVLGRAVSNERVLNAGELLLTIGRLEDLQVEADVLSQEVVAIENGDPADVFGPTIGTEPARASVLKIFPQGFTKVSSLGVEEQRVKVVLAFDPGERERLRREGRTLGVDYRVRVKIHTDTKEDALVIARSALFRSVVGGWRAFVVRDGRALLADLKVGLANDEDVEVLSGVEPGESVVLAPESSLTNGQRVEPQSASAENGE